MSFFGHTKRHNRLEYTILTILEGKLEIKRKRGTPKRAWADDIKNWLEIFVKEAGNLAYDNDRDQYRRHRRQRLRRQTSQPLRELTVIIILFALHKAASITPLAFLVPCHHVQKPKGPIPRPQSGSAPSLLWSLGHP